MRNHDIILATRKSPLALAQTALVRQHAAAGLPGNHFTTLPLVTTGDRQRHWSLEKQGGKGLFTGELEEALRRGDADLAVHSCKDLPTEMAEGLALAGFLPREDPRDVLIHRAGEPVPTRIATGSPRRRAQARSLFPDAEWCEIRGNVATRLRKIADGEAGATLLAMAGLKRLGITEWPGLVFRPLDIGEMVPAVGQAAIAIQCRAGEESRWSGLFDEPTRLAVTVERAFLAALGGGCHTAFGAHFHDGGLTVFHESSGRTRHEMPDVTVENAFITAGDLARARFLS